MEERLEDLLIAIEFEIKERLGLCDVFSEQDYIKGFADGLDMSLVIINRYKDIKR